MRLRQHRLSICLLALGALSACATHEQQSRQPAVPVAASVPQAWSFETEWARAAAESAPGSAGQAWERSKTPIVERAYGAVIDDCATPYDHGDPGATSDQRFVLEIAESGSVRQVWSENDSPLLTCARASLSRTQFAPLPMDGYRLGLLLDLGDPGLPQEIPRLPRPAPGVISSYEAMRMAATDMGTQEGQTYMESFFSTFEAVLLPIADKCMTIPLHETERSLDGYSLFIEIATDGTTQRVLVEPDPESSASEHFQSPRADCLRDGLGRVSLATPPWDGFWVFMGLGNPPPGLPTE
jgi:hypothetical protein